MKIQGLAVIAIIIILPMAIILNSYSDSQMKTLQLQVAYDAKLQNSTYDAIKAFQLNMSNSGTSNFAESKMRDIKASINTFYNSLSSNFNMSGLGESVLQNYVPAIVYTLYDGYYIYSAYDNKLDSDDADKINASSKYTDGKRIYGLKPYIYYSCRYKPNNDTTSNSYFKSNDDFVITYSLDSYITVQGTVQGNVVKKSGYLLTGVDKDSGYITYDDVRILEENNSPGLKQQIYRPGGTPSSSGDKLITFGSDWNSPGSLKWYQYKKINGVKFYKEGNSVFNSINDKILKQEVEASTITENTDGKKYYEEALDFSNWVRTNLYGLTTYDAVDQNGNSYQNKTLYPEDKNPPFQIKKSIFKELDNKNNGKKWLEDPDSLFNSHKTEVIKNSIETNLIAAISNYNNVSTSDVNFAMPKLQDYEWEELTKNISMITFLQGLSIGGKVYNGYSIVRNDLTEDYVSENSIYIAYYNTNMYYRVTDKKLIDDGVWNTNAIGLLNIDFERKTSLATAKKNDLSGEELTKNIYYYPRKETGAYSSIISLNDTENKTIFQYLKDGRNGDYGSDKIEAYYKLSQVYYTALGRERYEMYRANR